MATIRQSSLQQLLDCPICMEDNLEPRILPCQHTMCVGCIDRLNETTVSNTAACPICREEFQIPQGGAKALPTALALVQLRDFANRKTQLRGLANTKKEVKSQFQCKYCGIRGRNVSHMCQTCSSFMCEYCVTKHETQPFLPGNHKTEPISDNVCKDHVEHFMFFCQDCNRPLCKICMHRDICKGHQVKSISEFENLEHQQPQATGPEVPQYDGGKQKDILVRLIYKLPNTGVGQMDIAFTPDGNIAMTTYKDTILLLTVNNLTRTVRKRPMSAKQYFNFRSICGIAFHPQEHCLLICDTTGFISFLHKNIPLSYIKKEVNLQGLDTPQHIAVLENGCLVVSGQKKGEHGVGVVGVFDVEGKTLCVIEQFTWEGEKRSFDIGRVTTDSDNNIYISQWSMCKIVKLDQTGNTLGVWSVDNRPRGLTVWKNRLLIAERNYGVVSYTLDGTDRQTLVKWYNNERYGDIMSLAVQGDKLAVLGDSGVKVFELY